MGGEAEKAEGFNDRFTVPKLCLRAVVIGNREGIKKNLFLPSGRVSLYFYMHFLCSMLRILQSKEDLFYRYQPGNI